MKQTFVTRRTSRAPAPIEGISSSGTSATFESGGRNEATSAIEYSSMAAYYNAAVGSVITNAPTSSLSSQ